ncbi:MAG: hypothetical protein NVSMB9_09670 [Isosphaeraceae bacterium]
MIFIGTDAGIYRFFDGCNWPIFHGLQDRDVVGLASPGPGVLVALDRTGVVLESTNGGIGWEVVPLPDPDFRPTVIAVAGSPPSIVMASKQGLFRRAIGARSSSTSENGSSGDGPGARLLFKLQGAAEGATALLTRGRSRFQRPKDMPRLTGWSPLKTPGPESAREPLEVRSLTTASTSTESWFASIPDKGLWKSGDSGVTWTQCQGLPSEVNSVRAVPGRSGHLWAATHDGCWLSTDGGDTWEDRSAGLEEARHVSAIEIKPGAPDVLLLGSAPSGSFQSTTASPQGYRFRLYESANGGKSWTRVRKNFPEALDSDTITDIRHDPSTTDNIVVAFSSGELWNTSNGGAYWSPLARQIRAARVLCATA